MLARSDIDLTSKELCPDEGCNVNLLGSLPHCQFTSATVVVHLNLGISRNQLGNLQVLSTKHRGVKRLQIFVLHASGRILKRELEMRQINVSRIESGGVSPIYANTRSLSHSN